MAEEKNIKENFDVRMNFRITASMSVELVHQLSAANFKKSEWFREALIKNKTKIVVRQRKSIDATRILFLVNKASNNINQIAHNLNAGVKINTITPHAFEATLFELKALNDFLSTAAKDAD